MSAERTWRKIRLLCFEAVMLILTLVVIIPLLVMVFGSFKNAQEAALFNLKPPTKWLFSNYAYVFVHGNLGRALVNSFIVVVGSVGISIVASAPCSYILARRRTRFTTSTYNLFLIGLFAPIAIVPTVFLLKYMGILGDYWGLILVFSAVRMSFCVFLFTGFIRSVPRELDEAAYIDGASPTRIFISIIAPLLKPVMVTNLAITTMSVWNDYMLPMYLLSSPSKWTMPLTIYSFFGQYFRDWNLVFADLTITALPMIILYLFAQKYIVAGMTVGAVKA